MDVEPLHTNPYENMNIEVDDEIIQMYKTCNPEETKAKVKERLDELDNVTLNIAITGTTGAGKSTFVNALRGLANDDFEAAPTGVTETTLKNNMYLHPTMPNVKVWDLPGIGSPKFKAKKYLKEVKLATFDVFIILTAERFKENDLMLAKAIKKKKKLFYFVRTKIDNDIRAQKNKVNFDEQTMLKKMREDCQKNLAKVGSPKVFLISSLHLDKYDFKNLIDTLEDELPENKRRALIQSLPLYSLEVLEKKKQYLKKIIGLFSFSAGGFGASFTVLPVPGLPVICNVLILFDFFVIAYHFFGMDDRSLEKLATRVNKPVELLKSAKRSRFANGVNIGVVMQLFKSPLIITAMVALTLFNATWLGGALPAAAISLSVVHHQLLKGLEEMEEDAKAVLLASDLLRCQGISETVLKMKKGD